MAFQKLLLSQRDKLWKAPLLIRVKQSLDTTALEEIVKAAPD